MTNKEQSSNNKTNEENKDNDKIIKAIHRIQDTDKIKLTESMTYIN